MNYRRVSAIFTVVTIVLIIVVDIWLALAGGYGATISEVLRDWSYRANFIPYGMGILMGHWFFNRRDIPDRALRTGMMWLAWATIIVMALANLAMGLYTSHLVGIAALHVIGVIIGAVLWPMKARG